MSLFQDFSFELDAQKEVVRYIEISFEEEFGKASRLLESPLRPIGDVYSDNAEFISELKAKFDNAKTKISMGWQDAEEYPEWLYRVDQRDPLGEMINYCVDCIDNGESIDAERLNSKIVEWNEHMGERVYTGEMVEKALSVATSVWKHRINSGLENDDMNLDRLAATIRMLDVTANSNIYRQAFVNMFSIFDAYVFDYLKTYFFNHIDKLESFFGGEKTKLPYEDVFKNSTIEEAKEGADTRFWSVEDWRGRRVRLFRQSGIEGSERRKHRDSPYKSEYCHSADFGGHRRQDILPACHSILRGEGHRERKA